MHQPDAQEIGGGPAAAHSHEQMEVTSAGQGSATAGVAGEEAPVLPGRMLLGGTDADDACGEGVDEARGQIPGGGAAGGKLPAGEGGQVAAAPKLPAAQLAGASPERKLRRVTLHVEDGEQAAACRLVQLV